MPSQLTHTYPRYFDHANTQFISSTKDDEIHRGQRYVVRADRDHSVWVEYEDGSDRPLSQIREMDCDRYSRDGSWTELDGNPFMVRPWTLEYTVQKFIARMKGVSGAA